MAWRIGVDSGGTFTDICLFEDGSGNIAVWKVPSTPADPSHAVAEGVREALTQGAAQASDVSYFGHGTTVATNALIQHRGAPTGLMPSRPGEFHPEPLTDPDLTLSRHPARATERRLPPPVENWSSFCCQLAHSQRR